MNFGKFIGAVANVTPNLLFAFVTGWFNLFTNTSIMRADWGLRSERTGLALATALAIVFSLIFRKWPADNHKIWALRMLTIFAVLAVFSYGCSLFLDYPRTRQVQQLVIPVWDIASTACLVTITLSVLFGTMYAFAGESDPGI
ncbi:hypothetical protein C7I87_24265 [Mesorhizobium sp. SARCC-RB16n]|uniref:hypothetical protein n=1 Tax=Mesorhizobium sp. SARCC-RB16n TaxID=2116687 RepID=UPI00122F0B59|nr:hypothetical protein [Mesorhizobium sp. SARCC-RB16n]KAA3448056.1 hypothetical protein C7I87_24265 [Mesorhizobium sp. SARCC-RB16n]